MEYVLPLTVYNQPFDLLNKPQVNTRVRLFWRQVWGNVPKITVNTFFIYCLPIKSLFM